MARCTGTRTLRVEDPRLLTGTGTYVDDVVRSGMLHACFVRSPVARARIAGADVSEALQLDVVHAVFLAEDLNPGVRKQWYTLNGRDDPNNTPPAARRGRGAFRRRSGGDGRRGRPLHRRGRGRTRRRLRPTAARRRLRHRA
ncbi:hypothetical protein [Streptomyces sp. NPDC086519]|uniref:hypothetical protein n=1 Tax=Streptomyces sp. NPDC086519 TaxID=3154863 RepID=UPI00344342F0